MNALWLAEQRAFIRFLDYPGEEPALVLLHGLGSASTADFAGLARDPVLSRFRLILPDFLGFGYSDRPEDFDYSLEGHAQTVSAVLRHLGLATANVFGHSMGGSVAVVLAAAHPEQVRRLVLAEANLDPGVGGASKTIAAQTEEEYLAGGHALFLRAMAAEIGKSPSAACFAGALKAADPLAVHRSAAGLIHGAVPSQRRLFLAMKIPRAFLFSAESRSDPDVEILRGGGIDVFIVPNSGHGMMHDNPEGFRQALARSFDL
ncbi:MAG: alpha/beta fold hydrolase [Anaerolineales bacterium]|nr:alpha/beta fold hydrolase [Anaerolineales bacterium]